MYDLGRHAFIMKLFPQTYGTSHLFPSTAAFISDQDLVLMFSDVEGGT